MAAGPESYTAGRSTRRRTDAAPTSNAAQLASCGSLLSLTQALVGPGVAGAPRLVVVTAGAQTLSAGPVAVAQAPVLGLARTIALEHPELRTRCIDLDPADGVATGDLLAQELLSGDTESEIAYRSDDAAGGPARPVRRRSSRADRPSGAAARQRVAGNP